MSLVLDEDEYFSMQANVTNPGYQSVVLKGYITQQRADGVYAAPLLPQLFYGADGTQLSTWRQYVSGTGQQTILSRSGGLPTIPKEELYWRKISDFEEETVTPEPVETIAIPSTFMWALLALFVGSTIYFATRGK